MNENDKSTETMIQAAGLTAPRLSPTSIQAVIAGEHYFTAADGASGAQQPHAEALGLLTFCVLVLTNGFTVTGKSACVSPENFDANIGRKVARDDAISQVWPLEGYLLKQRLYDQQNPAVEPTSAPVTFQQRVVAEKAELAEKVMKLGDFLKTSTFERLPDEEQVRLTRQLEAMYSYHQVLAERIAAFPAA